MHNLPRAGAGSFYKRRARKKCVKADLHSHTHYSRDSIIRPKTWARCAHKAGLDAIALTDHETTKGWKEAKAECARQNLLFIPGIEFKVRENGKAVLEVLGLFISEEPKRRDAEALDEVHEQDGLVVVPHPFEKKWNRIPLAAERIGDFAKQINGVETFNARVLDVKYDRIALEWAKRNRKFETGSGDAHVPQEVGRGYTLAACEPSLEALRKAMLKRATHGQGRKSNLLLYLPAILANRGVWPSFLDV